MSEGGQDVLNRPAAGGRGLPRARQKASTGAFVSFSPWGRRNTRTLSPWLWVASTSPGQTKVWESRETGGDGAGPDASS